MTVLSKLYNALRSEVRSSGLVDETEPNVRCICCSTKERLCSFSNLKIADHICMGGQHSVITVGDRQVAAYTHHAIVKKVEVVAESTAMVTLIHFYSPPYDLSIQIQETTELLDLFYHEIYIIQYRHQTLLPETIISRAEGLIEQNKHAKYSILSCNCEHFCNWCCVGSENSYQADNAREVLKAILAGVSNFSGNTLKVVCTFLLLSIEDLSKVATGALVAVPWGVLSVMAILYLIYVIYRHFQLNKDSGTGRICKPCCLQKKHDLWMQFSAYCGLQVGGLGLLSLIISAGASGGIVTGALVACSFLSLVCISAVPRFRILLYSPFQGSLVRVQSMTQICLGDIISFDLRSISHDGIVSDVKINPKTMQKKGQLRVIHYSLPALFGEKTVVEEIIEVDLGKDMILAHDYTRYKVHEPENVVHRARQRLGEIKFGVLSNRSCHFCHWAKVNEDVDNVIVPEFSPPVLQYLNEIDPIDTISNLPNQQIQVDHKRGRTHSSRFIKKAWARIRDDIKSGQIIEFRYGGFWHKAVSTKVHYDEQVISKLSVTVVHYGKQRNVSEETFIFDLRYEDIWIYKYHPLCRHNTEDVIKRARARIKEENYSLLSHRSSHLANEIVLKDNDPVVTIDEIKPGDVVIVYFWSFKLDAVVTQVKRDDSKSNTSGQLRIIYYANDRMVKEDFKYVDLKRDLIYLKTYDGYVTYPPDLVVRRARSRVGEKRFSINGNTSSDLAHWAKVVQTPVLVSMSHIEAPISIGTVDDSFLLVPKAGRQCQEFQCFRANSWSDLYPGVIVEYRYYKIWHQGILSNKDEERKLIKVIHYGADHIFATREIMEDSIKFDIRYDNIWIYRGDPSQCYKPEVVCENARKRLGEKKWARGNRSWDFCKNCVLNKYSKEF